MSIPTPGASGAPTTPPASPAEANRPPDHSTPGLELRQLRAQVALCREVLAEVTPIVKARICMSPAGVDESVLGRIEQAINPPASERETLTPDTAAFRTHHLTETSRLTREVLELRADAEALATALESLAVRARYHVDCQPARIALNAFRSRHHAPVARISGSDCPANKDPGGKHNESAADMLRAASAPVAPVDYIPLGEPMIPLADAEPLAAALNDAMIALPHSIDRGAARDALLVYRSRHPAPKEPL